MTNVNGGHGKHGNGDHGSGKQKVTSLRDLPRAIEPSRDLWAGIELAIAAQRRGANVGADAAEGTLHAVNFGDAARETRGAARRQRFSPARVRWLAAAATIAALAVGVWIGRSMVPATGPLTAPPGRNTATTAQNNTRPDTQMTEAATAVQAAYLSDPKFRQERAALVKSLESKLASLPPDSREKVISSLATIHKSKQDLEDALGKDPTNALLQELLLNTYQDEMRVLTTVHEASDAGKGI